MDQAEVRRQKKIEDEINRKKVGEAARRVMDWRKLPVTQEMLAALEKVQDIHDKHILDGKCKDMEEYLGRCYARNKARGLFDLLAEFEKTFNKVLKSERGNN